ncbi:MAG: GNAT family N-acetyltransferase [Methanobacteriota archaeon]
MARVTVRPITSPQDVQRVVDIDKANTGNETRSMFLKENAEFHLKARGGPDDTVALVAEVDGRVAGFIIGRVAGPEFGTTERLGWISVVGVDPSARGHGVGTNLGNALLDAFRKRGVRRVRTQVNATDESLLGYFRSLGLLESRIEVMEKLL